MPDQTPNLSLPYLMPSQAQKHVTHNEALQQIDALAQLIVLESRNTVPAAPAEGSCYWITASPSGVWSGKAGQIGHFQDGSWQFFPPKMGWTAWFVETGDFRAFQSGNWVATDRLADNQVEMIGINATPDTTNRLSVNAAATLLNHAGSGHQLKLNKANSAATASLLYQSNFSGRAEMGLAGSDQFEIKVSPDGSAWTSALKILGSGALLAPARPLVRAALATGNVTPATATRTGFNTLHLNQGGFALGTAVPNGTGNRLIVPVTAPYLVILNTSAVAAANSAYTVGVTQNGTTTLCTLRDSDSASSSYTQTTCAIAFLTAGDWLALDHTGTATFEFGLGKTELIAIML
jgi:Protein of unknown function (DUF2793)